MRKITVLTSAILAVAALSGGSAFAGEDVQADIKALKARIAELEKKQEENWLTQERASQIKQLVTEVIADARTRGQFLDGDLQVGYNNGFFVKTADDKYRLVINGFFQYRYTFAQDSASNHGYATKPAHGDVNGFDFRYARITFSGNAFDPNITYKFTGDFATDSSNIGNFDLVDGFLGYRFNDQLNVRAGAFITPYSRVIYIADGMQFVDFPTIFNVFNPDRSMGASVHGELIKDKLVYEVNMNNGQKSNRLGRAAEIGSTNGNAVDNRLGFYSRWAYYSDGTKPAEFLNESDLRKGDRPFVWMLGAAGGYESANSDSTAFPNPQGQTTISGVSTNDKPGFTSYKLNGDIYRGTVDYSFKYQGWALTAAAFYQQINGNPYAGTVSGGLPSTGKSSFYQVAYYAQLGYMVTPNLELVARAGQLISDADPNRMEEYAIGANYYMYGKNVKLQTDFTYVPEAAYSSSTYSTALNTHDLIWRVQLQLKF